MIELAVTVSTYRFAEKARQRALEWGLPFVDRPLRGGLEELLRDDVRALLVLCGTGWRLKDREGECVYTPGMARVRVKRLLTGVQQPDQLVVLGELRTGDVIIDATLGAAADALVCAHVVGLSGRVIGVEASRAIYLLASESLPALRVSERACLVEPRYGKAHEVLAQMPAKSADCVLFDAMFDRKKRAAESFEVLRRFAVHEPIDPQTIELARAVARRWVIIKIGRYGRELQRLGLEAVSGTRGPLEWARVAAR